VAPLPIEYRPAPGCLSPASGIRGIFIIRRFNCGHPRLFSCITRSQSRQIHRRNGEVRLHRRAKCPAERIGPNKEAAEQRLREVLKARTEGRHINKSADAKTKFKDLAARYLELPEVKAKRSYDRDKRSLKLLLPFFGDKLLKDIKPGTVEAYRQRRLGEPSGRTPSTLTAPATVNRELACFKTIFSKAIKNGKAERNPAVGVRQLKENNERDRILSPEEYDRLLAHCPAHLKPVVKVAYHSGMRKSEILNLTWGKVDLKEGFIRLQADDTKTREARSIPLSPELMEMLPPGWG